MDTIPLNLLLKDLKDDELEVREAAAQELWRRWFEQKGKIGLQLLERSQTLQDQGAMNEAEAMLSQTIRSMPDFAEAWNRRAVVYFMQGRYRKAISDCHQTLALNPFHFGALHGMGLCYLRLLEYRQASQAFRQALLIQPHSVENQRMLLECTAQLS
jgi:tetratricopeptide (TPR) repeat protein